MNVPRPLTSARSARNYSKGTHLEQSLLFSNTTPVAAISLTRIMAAVLVFALLSIAWPVQAQYLGVTCGFNYSNDLQGPDTGTTNTPLYNPRSTNPNATWDDWAEELAASGVDFVCPNLRGSQPNTSLSPTNIAPLLTALYNRGLANRIKLAIFDDNASSWTAQWNEANGRGFDYAEPFDIGQTNNWAYLWDYNYKLFYQTVPDANRFKINGRPVIIIWTGNTYFIANMQGNESKALNYVRQQCSNTFGFNPYIIVSADTLQNDTTCNNPGVVDAAENWFTAGGPAYSLVTTHGAKIGALCPQFHDAGDSGFIDPNHGLLLSSNLTSTRLAGALLTLVEGFTDWEEDAALFRVRNLDMDGNALTYNQCYYDYPNQRLNILRQYGNFPNPCELKMEAEACDYFGGANAGNGQTNYYRNGNIAIETTGDTAGGYDVGWIQTEVRAAVVQYEAEAIHLQVRVASPNDNCKIHFVVDGTNYPSLTIPNTGSWQVYTNIESGTTYTFAKNSTHTVQLVCETGGFNINYWQYHDDIPLGKTISLQSQANGLWVTATNSTSPLIATKTTLGTTEQFQVVDQNSSYWYGCVALKSLGDNLYVTADPTGLSPLIANRTVAGPWETFQWTDNGDGTISLRALANYMVVTADGAGVQLLINNRISTGPLETFAVFGSDQAPAINRWSVSEGNLILLGTNGFAGGSYSVLTSTNVALPLSSWTTNTSGVFDGSGAFSNAIPINATEPARFYRLKQP